MSKDVTKNTVKGRLSWLIPVLDAVVMIAYFAIGFKGIIDGFKEFDFEGMFESVQVAIIFLLVATLVITVMCFIPIFKSKANVRIAIWNIIWMGFTIYTLVA